MAVRYGGKGNISHTNNDAPWCAPHWEVTVTKQNIIVNVAMFHCGRCAMTVPAPVSNTKSCNDNLSKLLGACYSMALSG